MLVADITAILFKESMSWTVTGLSRGYIRLGGPDEDCWMQGAACVFPAFREVFEEVPQDDGALTSTTISMPGTRIFRNTAGDMRWCPPVPIWDTLCMLHLCLTLGMGPSARVSLRHWAAR